MIKLALLTTDNREQLRRYEDPEPYFGTAISALLNGFELLPDELEVHVISCARKPMQKPKKLASNIWFHQPIVSKLGWGRSAFVGCGFAARKVIGGIDPDLVHAQGTERDCAVSMMLAPRLPRLLTIHGHMARIREITEARFPSYYWMAAKLEAMAVRNADGVVALSRYTQARVETVARRTWVLPNAVDNAFFGVNNHSEGRLTLCVAHISSWKRQVELMEALDSLPGDRKPELVFLGASSASVYGARFASEVAKRPWCRHEGNASREELRAWLARARLVVLPSIEDNCPMVILEAMAARVPVVAAAIGGIPDLVIPGTNGELFDPLNPDDMAKRISQILDDDALRERYAAASLTRAKAEHHPFIIAQKHLDIYRTVLRAKTPPKE